MTEKRFTKDDTLIFSSIKDNGKPMKVKEVVDLLNELYDEKQSVIKWIDRTIEEIKPYNSELCRMTLLELKEFLE